MPKATFIEATPETPYFQIGETKYGKPIIDRVITADTAMDDAVKCVLVSFDSTMRSNLSVGMPIDLACYPATAALSASAPLRRARPLHDLRCARAGAKGCAAPLPSCPIPSGSYAPLGAGGKLGAPLRTFGRFLDIDDSRR
jgi:hypothetical protein